jgi:hypothetical protein
LKLPLRQQTVLSSEIYMPWHSSAAFVNTKIKAMLYHTGTVVINTILERI